MSTNTVNFNWILPTVGGDSNIWGSPDLGLNKNLVSQDSLVRRLMNTFISATAPTELQSGTMWIDSTTNPWIWNVYNSGTTTWIKIGEIDNVANTFTPVTGDADGFAVGDYKYSSIASAHGKWLICNGAAISRATYSALFTLFNALTPQLPFGGGDGVTTFNLPDLRGAVGGAIGLSGLSALTPNTPWSAPTTWTIGNYKGEEAHTLISAELPDPITSASAQASFSITGGANGIQSTAGSGLGGNAGIIRNVGGNATHNTMQPTVFAGNYFIFTGV